jgi:hypothetical protein
MIDDALLNRLLAGCLPPTDSPDLMSLLPQVNSE